MATITILPETTKNPLDLIGRCAGTCYGVENISDIEKNKKRALNCIKSGHDRVLEYPQIFLVLDGYSARTFRQLYCHIGGAPTRLQASTRYIDYTKNGFSYVIPPSIEKNQEARLEYIQEMLAINKRIRTLIDTYDIPQEDAALLLPLGMESKVVFRTNARQLIDMSRTRTCNRAYWEFRDLMRDIKEALSNYSEEWKELLNTQFGAKCDFLGYCPESKGCGKYPGKF